MRKSVCYVTADGEIHSQLAAAQDHATKQYEEVRESLFEALGEFDNATHALRRDFLDFMEENHVEIARMVALKMDREMED